MTFDDLKEELFARGTNYLEENATEIARAERWLNQAYREVCNLHVWPFLIATATDTDGSVTISDLRRVVSVTANGVPLAKATYEELINDDFVGDQLTVAGTPELYWIDQGATVKTYPVGTNVSVRYIKRIPPLETGQSPVFDEEYHNVIVDKAMIRAYVDSDNFEAAQALKTEVNETLASMAEDYLLDSRGPSYIQVVEPTDG